VHARAMALSAGHAESLPPEWLRRSLAAGPGVRRSSRFRLSRWPMPVLVGVAGALLILAGSWTAGEIPTRNDHERLAGRMRRDSFGGPIYGEAFLPERSGVRGDAPDAGADQALADMVHRSGGTTRSADEAFWLVAGFLSHNDLDNADAYLRASTR